MKHLIIFCLVLWVVVYFYKDIEKLFSGSGHLFSEAGHMFSEIVANVKEKAQ